MDNFELKKTICKLITCIDKTEIAKSFNKIVSADWNYIYDFLSSYNLCPLFYSLVKENDLNVPIEITNKLQQNYFASSSQYLKRAHDIKSVLLEFNKENIDVIPLKGVYLADKYYKNPVTRTMCDIDLLVKKEDVRKSLEILNKIGFKSSKEYDYDFWLNNQKHIPAYYSKNNISIELHATLLPEGRYSLKNVNIDLDNIWSSCAETCLCKQKSFRMSTENLILHLCIHIAEDKFKQKILQLLDIYQIIQNENINWQRLVSKSKEWNAEKILYSTLVALNKLFDLEVNKIVQQRIEVNERIFEIGYALERIILSDISLQDENKISDFKHKNFKERMKYFKYSMFSNQVICTIYGISDKSLKKYLYYIPRFSYLLKTYSKVFLNLYIFKKGKNFQDISKCNNLFDQWVNS